MPELPEVETIVRDLEPVLRGAKFVNIETTHAPAVVSFDYDFDVLRDKDVLAIERRGKFINLFFEDDFVVTIHLRMSGRLLIKDKTENPLKFERTRIDFDGCSLRFCDMRKFGKVWLNRVDNYEEKTGISRLGVEPLGNGLDLKMFLKIFRGRRGVVKKWLLDQSMIAGIGNIYADEACFYAGVRPDSRMENLSPLELEKLFEAIIKALKQGVVNRGTSIADFADAYGRNGKNQELLYVYGRGGKECFNCKTKLEKVRLVGRGTVFCPSCQN
jgi:formamidopyrimidine-DNA glycosylase